jgi:DNA repair protein RAD51
MISTGIKKLDEILSGGIHDSQITDIYGESGTGKTQLALQIAINGVLDGRKVLFQDITGSFRPERLLEIQKERGLVSSLEQISVSKIRNTSDQIQSIEIFKKSDYSLIIIDNVTDLFSFEYANMEQTSTKNLLFMNYIHELSLLAIKRKIPIVLTNMIRNVDGKKIENMVRAVSPYTHLQIKLEKNHNKLQGQVTWLLNKLVFNYEISSSGLVDTT